MKHNLLKSVIISVILLMGVSNAWADITFSGGYIYFDNSIGINQTYIQLCARQSSWTGVSTMTNISNTKLYYVAKPQGSGWGGILGWVVIGNSTAKSNSNFDNWTSFGWCSNWNEYGFNDGSTYLIVPTSTSKSQSVNTSYLSGGYSALNSQQTIKSAVNGTDANSKATISVTSYAMSKHGTSGATQQTSEISTSAKSTTISAARTATTTLTVGTVATGYQFDGWYAAKTGGTALSTSTNYTYYPTAATTVYARFSEITYSVQVKSADNNQGTVNPTPVNAGQFTGITITATPKIGYAFKNWTATDGITINNPNSASTTIKATKAGTVTANFEEKPATTIYLEPTGHWNPDKAVFQAHVWQTGKTGVNLDMTGVGEPSYADGDNKSPYRYYKVEVPYGYDKILFFRKDNFATANGNAWNQTADLTIPTDNKTLYVITDNTTSPATGEWKEANLVYTITLNSCAIGTYGFKYNGKTYFSKANENVTVNIPAGAEIQIPAGQPHSDIYEGKVIKLSPTKEQLTTDQIITVNGNITLDDNFVTKDAHVVYLGVPDDLTTWTSGTYSNFIWHWNTMGSLGLIASTSNFKIDNITYYEYTIPAGSHTFCFQRKTSVNDNGTPQKESVRFAHHVPTNAINCFVLNNTQDGANHYQGSWTTIPKADGDYRILYIEQQVAHGTGADDWKTVIDTTYQHSSDIIKKGDGATIVSLHIDYDEKQHPEVILQKFTNGEWVDVEGQAHMVLGPLTASADMAMLPGRRNAEGDANLRYGDGIEEIKADAEENGKAGRVWNFVVVQEGTSAYIDFTDNAFAPYTGDYYIRTDNAAGGWVCYNHPRNVMSRSEYSLEHSGYSHYFCKWVALDGTPNVKFVVANDYGAAISDTIASDKYTDTNGTLEADANVRWMWNEYTNECSRAYIAGSSVSNFLVAKYAASSTKTFVDKGEWVYEVDLTDVKIDDKLTSIAATYDAQVQELLEKSHVDAGGLVMLASAGNDARVSYYTVRIVYDFKINQTICYLIPTGTAVATSIDVLIERINQDEEGNATQVTAAITPANAEGLTVYGLITLTKDHITDPNKSEQEALTYWISFPFDVKIGDITGFGEVGKHWMIKYYDGAERAAKGWFLDTKTFWKFFLDTEDVMKANTGYVLTLNKSLLNASNPVYDNTNTLKLYFPSKEKITGEINSNLTETSVTLEPLECKITSPADRTIKDSHWNLIGVPSYAHKNNNNEDVKFFYDYDFHEDKYSAEKNAGPNTFYAMHAYMVQYHGTINWSTFTTEPAQLAAKKNADAEEQYTLRLELQQNGTKADQTFVELHDDATTMFDMNVDLTKMFNASSANIYTLIGSDNQVAANVMPIANTVIPVGVQIAKAGEYTFAMPDGTDGITVELIDYETNTRTNLLLSEYTVDLNAGTFETRFALHVKPSNVTTSIDPVPNEDGQVRKLLMNGQLYLFKDGQLYDAQGRCVQ